jgi:hypothetical protein
MLRKGRLGLLGERRGKVDEQAVAVLAHGLLASVAVVINTTDRLASSWPADEEERAVLLQRLRDHAVHVGGVLEDLVRGLPRDVIAALDNQRRPPETRIDLADQLTEPEPVVLGSGQPNPTQP